MTTVEKLRQELRAAGETIERLEANIRKKDMVIHRLSDEGERLEADNYTLQARLLLSGNETEKQGKRMAELEAENDKPNLGLATTAEMLEELKVRAEVTGYANFRTVDEHPCFPLKTLPRSQTMSDLVKVLRGHYMSVCPGKITREQRYYLDAIRTSLDEAADHIEDQDKRIAELESYLEDPYYETEYDGRMYEMCFYCGNSGEVEHSPNCPAGE